MKNLILVVKVFFVTSTMVMALQSSELLGQSFVEYPGHGLTFGDHIVATRWTDGPTTVTLTMDSDETVLYVNGRGQSQRTGGFRMLFVKNGSPQNYDNHDVENVYGPRLSLLQQNSANGTSTLSYQFSDAVNQRVNLFITDVDTADDVAVRASGHWSAILDC